MEDFLRWIDSHYMSTLLCSIHGKNVNCVFDICCPNITNSENEISIMGDDANELHIPETSKITFLNDECETYEIIIDDVIVQLSAA